MICFRLPNRWFTSTIQIALQFTHANADAFIAYLALYCMLAGAQMAQHTRKKSPGCWPVLLPWAVQPHSMSYLQLHHQSPQKLFSSWLTMTAGWLQSSSYPSPPMLPCQSLQSASCSTCACSSARCSSPAQRPAVLQKQLWDWRLSERQPSASCRRCQHQSGESMPATLRLGNCQQLLLNRVAADSFCGLHHHSVQLPGLLSQMSGHRMQRCLICSLQHPQQQDHPQMKLYGEPAWGRCSYCPPGTVCMAASQMQTLPGCCLRSQIAWQHGQSAREAWLSRLW